MHNVRGFLVVIRSLVPQHQSIYSNARLRIDADLSMCAELIRDQDSLEFSLICLHTFITVFVNNLIIYITLDSYFLLFYEKGVFPELFQSLKLFCA